MITQSSWSIHCEKVKLGWTVSTAKGLTLRSTQYLIITITDHEIASERNVQFGWLLRKYPPLLPWYYQTMTTLLTGHCSIYPIIASLFSIPPKWLWTKLNFKMYRSTKIKAGIMKLQWLLALLIFHKL